MEAETSRLSDFIGGPEKSGNSSFRLPFGECMGPFKGPIPTLSHGNRQDMAFEFQEDWAGQRGLGPPYQMTSQYGHWRAPYKRAPYK